MKDFLYESPRGMTSLAAAPRKALLVYSPMVNAVNALESL